MTESTPETNPTDETPVEAPRSVRSYRHQIKRDLHEAQSLLNGAISGYLRGKPGYTQEQQVERLASSKERFAENVETLKESLAAIEALMVEATTYAAERDFEAWQARKHRSYPYAGVEDATDDVEIEDDDEEDED